jgi:hypothetical protein
MKSSIRTFVVAAATLVSLSACDSIKSPTAVSPHRPSLVDRAPTTASISVRQRVAALRRQRLTAGDRKAVDSNRDGWKWVADFHHRAMQEAMHDPSVGGLRRQRSESESCALIGRYAPKYAASVAAEQRVQGREQAALLSDVANRILPCESLSHQANFFSTARPTMVFHVTPTTPVAVRATADVTNEYHAYITALLEDLRGAKDLGDANDIMDAYVAAAASDPAVNPAALKVIAGTIDLGRSSAEEWDTYAQHQGSLFLWGWLSDLGNWIVDVVTADIDGCEDGFYVGWGAVEATGGFYGSAADFLGMSAGFCGVGGAIGSFGAAM